MRIFRGQSSHEARFVLEWLIAEIHEKYPDAQFLSEAFTRPKMMAVLAKAGFTQSYTYFTWRNTKWELETYLTQLTQTEMKDFFRRTSSRIPRIFCRIFFSQVGARLSSFERFSRPRFLRSMGSTAGSSSASMCPFRERRILRF